MAQEVRLALLLAERGAPAAPLLGMLQIQLQAALEGQLQPLQHLLAARAVRARFLAVLAVLAQPLYLTEFLLEAVEAGVLLALLALDATEAMDLPQAEHC